MLIHNIIPEFLALYESKEDFQIPELEAYLQSHSKVFDRYFPNHCPRTDERLQAAIQQYPKKIGELRIISDQLPKVIEEMESNYSTMFLEDFNLGYKIIVGTFGSNAFVSPENRREIYFAAEKLSSKTDHLKVIAAHEIGHVAHFSFATNQGMDWTTVDWMHGLTTLYTEGAATYLSKKLVPHLNESMYFTYDDDGDPWVMCYEKHKEDVKRRFLKDVEAGWDMAKEKEWFRLSGGEYFGHNRLGYLLGTDYVEHLVQIIGEEKALTFWKGNDLKEDIRCWLAK